MGKSGSGRQGLGFMSYRDERRSYRRRRPTPLMVVVLCSFMVSGPKTVRIGILGVGRSRTPVPPLVRRPFIRMFR